MLAEQTDTHSIDLKRIFSLGDYIEIFKTALPIESSNLGKNIDDSLKIIYRYQWIKACHFASILEIFSRLNIKRCAQSGKRSFYTTADYFFNFCEGTDNVPLLIQAMINFIASHSTESFKSQKGSPVSPIPKKTPLESSFDKPLILPYCGIEITHFLNTPSIENNQRVDALFVFSKLNIDNQKLLIKKAKSSSLDVFLKFIRSATEYCLDQSKPDIDMFVKDIKQKSLEEWLENIDVILSTFTPLSVGSHALESNQDPLSRSTRGPPEQEQQTPLTLSESIQNPLTVPRRLAVCTSSIPMAESLRSPSPRRYRQRLAASFSSIPILESLDATTSGQNLESPKTTSSQRTESPLFGSSSTKRRKNIVDQEPQSHTSRPSSEHQLRIDNTLPPINEGSEHESNLTEQILSAIKSYFTSTPVSQLPESEIDSLCSSFPNASREKITSTIDLYVKQRQEILNKAKKEYLEKYGPPQINTLSLCGILLYSNIDDLKKIIESYADNIEEFKEHGFLKEQFISEILPPKEDD
ncbi:MAG: hypothetical protein HEEMFOPI_00120 [Holosporales bacterium]